MGCAIGMLETYGLLSAIEGLDAALKAANVTLRSFDYVSGGLIAWVVEGEVGAVRVAVSAGKAAASRLGEVISDHVIARPSKDVGKTLPPPARPGGRKGGTGIHKRDFPIGSPSVKARIAQAGEMTPKEANQGAGPEVAHADDLGVRYGNEPIVDLMASLKITEKVPPNVTERVDQKAAEKVTEQVDQKVAEKAAEKGDQKVSEQVDQKVTEKVAPGALPAVAGEEAEVVGKTGAGGTNEIKLYTREELEVTGVYDLRAIARRMEGIG
jgi:microcompartment protein CcmL/EutN